MKINKELQDKLVRNCKNNDIVFMAVFGSVVRGDERQDSDVDIAIRYDKSRKKTLFDLLDLEEDLGRVFGRRVDLGIFDSISPYIIEDIKKEMQVIYGKR